MHDIVQQSQTPARRSSRATRPRYQAVVEVVYPATEDLARRRRDHGERDHAWAKSRPGEPVPDWVIAMSPGQLTKGRVEEVPAADGEEV